MREKNISKIIQRIKFDRGYIDKSNNIFNNIKN